MKVFYLAIAILLSNAHVLGASDKVYKTTDEMGNPVFSDEASSDAEEVEVGEPTTFSGQQLTEQYDYYSPDENNDSDQAAHYDSLAITYPGNDQTIRSNPGDLEVRFNVSPAPKSGHRLQLVMDGQVYRTLKSAGPVQLTNVDRGTHNLNLQVVDEEGEVIQEGPAVTMHLLRHSILHPQGRKRQNQ